MSQRTENAKFFVEPNGAHTAEFHSGPIHFRDDQGTWREIDTALVPSPTVGYDWKNRQGPISVDFASAAGAPRAVLVRSDQTSVGFGLAGGAGLAPVVDANRITYSNVYPGVDLRFEVQPTGLKELIVLKDPPSSSVSFPFPLVLQNLTARQEPSGEISLVEPGGNTIFRIPRAWMEDSSVDPRSKEPAFSENVIVTLGLEGRSQVVRVTPDLAWLRDPARVYPVTIDPSITFYVNTDTFVQSNILNTPQNTSDELKAGTYDGGATKARTLLKFTGLDAALDGKNILSADLKIYEFHSWSCTPREVHIRRLTEDWPATVTWPNQPSAGSGMLNEINVAKGYSGSCPDWWITFDAIQAVQNWVNDSWENYGFRVQASSESDNYGWKKFFSEDKGTTWRPKLVVSYNSYPPTPAKVSPIGTNPIPVVPSIQPVLTAGTVTDPDGDTVSYRFRLASDASFTSNVHTGGWFRAAAGGTSVTYTVPESWALRDGQNYYWGVQAKDGLGDTSAWSAGQQINVRLTKLGTGGSWPIWRNGLVAVNQVNGNLVLTVPGVSHPTATMPMQVSFTYNSLDTANNGFGPGWMMNNVLALSNPPVKLVVLSSYGSSSMDAVQEILQDGTSRYYNHVGNSGTYVATPGSGNQLTKNANGTWTLFSEDGGIYTFGAADSNGNALLTSAQVMTGSPSQGAATYTYSVTDPTKVVSIADSAGQNLTFSWNSLDASNCPNAILCVAGPDGVKWRFAGDGPGGTSGKLARVNNGTRDLFAFSYDPSNRVNKIQNANDLNPSQASPGYNGNHAITVAYDGNGRVQSVSDGPISSQTPNTSTWGFAYSPGSVSTSPTRAAHEGIAAGTARTADGYTVLTPPNQQGQPNPKTDKVYYDNLGNLMERVDPLGRVTLASYDSSGELQWFEDADGNPTDYSMDSVSRVLRSVTGPDPDGAGPLGRPVTAFRYDESEIGTSGSAGPAIQGLQASYYSNPNLAGQPAALLNDPNVDATWGAGGVPALGGQVDNFSVRWTGNLSVSTPGDYTFSVQANDGVRLTVDGVDAIERWGENAYAQVSWDPITLSAGVHPITLEYQDILETGGPTGQAQIHLRWSCPDTGPNLCSPAIPDQVIPASALLPAWELQTSEVDPGGVVKFRHFAAPATGDQDYDLVRLGDGTNVITSYAYDAFGRITQQVMPKGNAGRTISGGALQGSPNLTFSTNWTYYGLSDTAAPPPGCPAGPAVTQGGLLKSVVPHGLAGTTSVYDAAGRPIALTRGAGVTCQVFDAEGRLVQDKAPGESQWTTYTYDPVGALRIAFDASGSVTTDYDEAGRVKHMLDRYGAESQVSFDANGNTLQRTAAAGALASGPNYTTSFVYDAGDQPSSMTDPAGRSYSFAYDSRGNLHAVQYPNGTFAWHDYNAAGWVTNVYNRHGTLPFPLPSSVPADGNPLIDFAYTYDIVGRIKQETLSGGGITTEVTSFNYDPLGRLYEVTLPNGTVRNLTYDLDSNRTQITETPPGGSATVLATYTYDPVQTPGLDQLTSITQGSTSTFTYDTDGRTATKGNTSIVWDGRDRLTGGTFSGTSVSYGFDALGRRVSRTTASTTRYLYACGCANGAPVFETDSGGAITLASVDSPIGDVARYSGPPTQSSQVTFAYYSGLGHLASEADSSGARTAYYTYDPFGAGNQTVPPNSVVERWEASRDKQFDSSAGLIGMGARSYDPALGRFLTVDPLLMGSLNLYDFASQDPVNQTDPSGLHRQSRRFWCNWGQTGFAFFRVWSGPGTTIYAWFTLRHRGGYSTYIDIVEGYWLRPERVWNLFSWFNPTSNYRVTYFDVSVPRGHISYLYVGCGWY